MTSGHLKDCLEGIFLKDKELIRSRFDRAMETYQANAGVQDMMAERLMDMVALEGRRQSGNLSQNIDKRIYGQVLEVGCGTGLLTRRIVGRFRPEMLWLNDLCPSAERYIPESPEVSVSFFAGDAETVDFPEGLDLIMSSATVQWFDDLPAFFSKCADALKPGGLIAFSTFGSRNLMEIAGTTGAGLEYYDMTGLMELLDERFEVLAPDEDIIRLEFSTPMDVLRHLRETGVTGISREKWTRGRMMDFVHRYEEMYGDGKCVPLTYNPIWIVARAVR